jgi:hypothetical protein
MSETTILLDPKIRDWVLIPIFVVMFLVGILRQYATVLLRDEKRSNKGQLDEIESQQALQRSRRLRTNAAFIPAPAFRMRKAYFVQEGFKERKQGEESGDANNPMAAMQDPFAMLSMMKQNMAMIVPQMVMMGWISYFFSGFVLVKLPFGLSDRFKSMLQRGIGLQSLDVSYVSSLSWYFLLLFGMRGVFDMVLGDNNDANDNTKALQMQMTGGLGMGGPGQPDTNKLMQTEKTELEIHPHDFAIAAAEQRLIVAANK